MTRSAIRRPSFCRATRGGFTLLEIILSIAIIAMIAAVLVGGSVALLNEQPLSVDEVFWRAVQEARKTALTSEHEVRLKFDAQKKQFDLFDSIAPPVAAADGITKEEIPIRQFPIAVASGSDLTVDFLSATKGGSSILVGGMLLESQPLSFVSFYSDGTCAAFRVQVVSNGATHVLGVDPWTCAQVLESKEATP